MIETIFIIALSVLFIHVTFWEGMIFESIGKKLSALPHYIRKPVYDCPICMVPWWGSLLLYGGNIAKLWEVQNATEWIFILFAAGGINTVLIYIVESGKAVSKALNDSDCNCTKKLTQEDKAEERKNRIDKFVTNNQQ